MLQLQHATLACTNVLSSASSQRTQSNQIQDLPVLLHFMPLLTMHLHNSMHVLHPVKGQRLSNESMATIQICLDCVQVYRMLVQQLAECMQEGFAWPWQTSRNKNFEWQSWYIAAEAAANAKAGTTKRSVSKSETVASASATCL